MPSMPTPRRGILARIHARRQRAALEHVQRLSPAASSSPVGTSFRPDGSLSVLSLFTFAPQALFTRHARISYSAGTVRLQPFVKLEVSAATITLSGSVCHVFIEIQQEPSSASFETDSADPVFATGALRVPLSVWELRSSGMYVCTALPHVGDINFATPIGRGGTLS